MSDVRPRVSGADMPGAGPESARSEHSRRLWITFLIGMSHMTVTSAMTPLIRASEEDRWSCVR